METVTHVVPGADGELISVEEFGAPDGKPVLVHPGSPGSRRLFRPDAELAARRYGLRLLSYDRPGYRGRPRREGRRIADAAADVRSLAAALGIDRLGMWGFSGGGSYALACAAVLPELVTGAAVFAGFAPYGAPGLDFCAGTTPEFAHEVELFFTDRETAREHWKQDADRHLAAIMRDSLSDGDDAWWDDWAATLTPWGCDPTSIRVPVRLWHGVHDRAVPIVNGRWLAAHVPGIVAHLIDSADHTNVEHDNREAAYAWLSELP
jgi:pimeloyl-ACP methyl ester carboxylesterase